MTVQEKPQARVYTILDFDQIIKGEIMLPNPETIPPLRFLNNIASGGHMLRPQWGYSRDHNNHKAWTQFFLRPTPGGGGLDGSGYAIVYDRNNEPLTLTFAICKHEKVDGPGANHSRGWHPGRCRLCGMDMTYDSGD